MGTGVVHERSILMEFTQSAVRECLRKNVLDPELEINVVDLGLIYNIDVHNHKIYVEMTLTNPGCPSIGKLAGGVEAALRAEFGEEADLDVNIVWDPPWSPEMISKEAKAELGF